MPHDAIHGLPVALTASSNGANVASPEPILNAGTPMRSSRSTAATLNGVEKHITRQSAAYCISSRSTSSGSEHRETVSHHGCPGAISADGMCVCSFTASKPCIAALWMARRANHASPRCEMPISATTSGR
jgi:hypothetical protein